MSGTSITAKFSMPLRQKPVHLRLLETIFTFNTAVVTTLRAGKNFKWSKV